MRGQDWLPRARLKRSAAHSALTWGWLKRRPLEPVAAHALESGQPQLPASVPDADGIGAETHRAQRARQLTRPWITAPFPRPPPVAVGNSQSGCMPRSGGKELAAPSRLIPHAHRRAGAPVSGKRDSRCRAKTPFIASQTQGPSASGPSPHFSSSSTSSSAFQLRARSTDPSRGHSSNDTLCPVKTRAGGSHWAARARAAPAQAGCRWSRTLIRVRPLCAARCSRAAAVAAASSATQPSTSLSRSRSAGMRGQFVEPIRIHLDRLAQREPLAPVRRDR